MTSLTPDTVVGHHVLEEKLGEGGFGEVWRARRHPEAPPPEHPDEPDVVAVKIARDPGRAPALRREAALLKKLDHPDIVRIFGVINVFYRALRCRDHGLWLGAEQRKVMLDAARRSPKPPQTSDMETNTPSATRTETETVPEPGPAPQEPVPVTPVSTRVGLPQSHKTKLWARDKHKAALTPKSKFSILLLVIGGLIFLSQALPECFCFLLLFSMVCGLFVSEPPDSKD